MFKSKFTTNESPVYISDYMSGKMSGIPAISTACQLNPICQKRHECKGSICEKCFAFATTQRYHKLEEHIEENYELLTSRLLEDEELPKFSYTVNMARIEAFGDLANATQGANYFKIIEANPHVHFGWWTKNDAILRQALELYGKEKPTNVQIILSSPYINEKLHKDTADDLIDKVFTVYDKTYIKAHDININCGAKSCAGCGLCYFDTAVKYIYEELK